MTIRIRKVAYWNTDSQKLPVFNVGNKCKSMSWFNTSHTTQAPRLQNRELFRPNVTSSYQCKHTGTLAARSAATQEPDQENKSANRDEHPWRLFEVRVRFVEADDGDVIVDVSVDLRPDSNPEHCRSAQLEMLLTKVKQQGICFPDMVRKAECFFYRFQRDVSWFWLKLRKAECSRHVFAFQWTSARTSKAVWIKNQNGTVSWSESTTCAVTGRQWCSAFETKIARKID